MPEGLAVMLGGVRERSYGQVRGISGTTIEVKSTNLVLVVTMEECTNLLTKSVLIV